MQAYLGVDFHPHQQTVDLFHQTEQVKEFYKSFPPAIVGIEASTNAIWFEALMSETGHHLLVSSRRLCGT